MTQVYTLEELKEMRALPKLKWWQRRELDKMIAEKEASRRGEPTKQTGKGWIYMGLIAIGVILYPINPVLCLAPAILLLIVID
jgi:hypothetical protein